MENVLIALLIIAGIVGSLVLLVLQFRNGLRTVASILHLNLGGEGPTKRLFPNLAFLGLFLLLIKLTWF